MSEPPKNVGLGEWCPLMTYMLNPEEQQSLLGSFVNVYGKNYTDPPGEQLEDDQARHNNCRAMVNKMKPSDITHMCKAILGNNWDKIKNIDPYLAWGLANYLDLPVLALWGAQVNSFENSQRAFELGWYDYWSFCNDEEKRILIFLACTEFDTKWLRYLDSRDWPPGTECCVYFVLVVCGHQKTFKDSFEELFGYTPLPKSEREPVVFHDEAGNEIPTVEWKSKKGAELFFQKVLKYGNLVLLKRTIDFYRECQLIRSPLIDICGLLETGQLRGDMLNQLMKIHPAQAGYIIDWKSAILMGYNVCELLRDAPGPTLRDVLQCVCNNGFIDVIAEIATLMYKSPLSSIDLVHVPISIIIKSDCKRVVAELLRGLNTPSVLICIMGKGSGTLATFKMVLRHYKVAYDDLCEVFHSPNVPITRLKLLIAACKMDMGACLKLYRSRPGVEDRDIHLKRRYLLNYMRVHNLIRQSPRIATHKLPRRSPRNKKKV
jgi:hypothetical protein